MVNVTINWVSLSVEKTQRARVANSGGSRLSLMGRVPTPKVGEPAYYLAKFSLETAWNEKKLNPERGCDPGTPLDPPIVNEQTSNLL